MTRAPTIPCSARRPTPKNPKNWRKTRTRRSPSAPPPATNRKISREPRPAGCPGVSLDSFVIRPNHFHAVFSLRNDLGATQRVAPTQETSPGGPPPCSVGAIVAQFKSKVTKRFKSSRKIPIDHLWQRNYYEHVVRDEADLNRIRQYIEYNPTRWLEDQYYSSKGQPAGSPLLVHQSCFGRSVRVLAG